MPRVKLIPDDKDDGDSLTNAVRQRRGGALLKLDRAMLNSRAVVAGWNALLGSVNANLRTDSRTRELLVCAVGQLNNARYQVAAHGRNFLAAGGTQEQLDALVDVRSALSKTALFGPADIALLRLAFEMTENVAVEQSTFDAVRDVLAEDELIVEVVTIIASYNMVSRFVVALDLDPDDGGL